jgi:hypothetical protein
MPRLGSTFDSYVSGLFAKVTNTAANTGFNFLVSAGLRLLVKEISKSTSVAGVDVSNERIADAGTTALSAFARFINTFTTEGERTLPLYNQFPGFIAEYKLGVLHDIIPLQFEAVITSDSRSAEFASVDFGVNSLDTYKKTSLRKLSLKTTFATLDQLIYTSHYVETKVRKFQSLLYPQLLESGTAGGTGAMVAPSLIGLYIGDKFMRRRLPRVMADENGTNGSLTKIVKALGDNSTTGNALNKNLGFLATAEPIIWRVDSVNVDWGESPVNTNFSEFSYNLIPGESKLPMFQTVSLELTEHRPPNTFETYEDVETFTGLTNFNSLFTNLT